MPAAREPRISSWEARDPLDHRPSVPHTAKITANTSSRETNHVGPSSTNAQATVSTIADGSHSRRRPPDSCADRKSASPPPASAAIAGASTAV